MKNVQVGIFRLHVVSNQQPENPKILRTERSNKLKNIKKIRKTNITEQRPLNLLSFKVPRTESSFGQKLDM